MMKNLSFDNISTIAILFHLTRWMTVDGCAECEAELGYGKIISQTTESGEFVRVALMTATEDSFVTVEEATNYCECEYNTQLASIHSIDENNDIFGDGRWYNHFGSMWIGLNDIDIEGDYVWQDGSTVDYTNFYQNQPNNWRNQDCNLIFYENGQWQDADCDGIDDNIQVVAWVCNAPEPATLAPSVSPTVAVEDDTCAVMSENSNNDDVSAFYRWYHSSAVDHFYTTDSSGELAVAAGYNYEGIECYLWNEETSDATVALYRWYHPTAINHFYTTDANGELAPSLGYTYEGIAGYIMTKACDELNEPLYRWYHASAVNHFYTTDASGELAPSLGYTYEGIVGYVALQPSGTTPMPTPLPTPRPTLTPTAEPATICEEIENYETSAFYRWFSGHSGDHFYTTDSSGELAVAAGYGYEGIQCYIWNEEITGITVAFYRWFSATSGDHFYTTDSTGELASSSGYVYEGIAGYIMTQSCNGVNVALYRWFNPTSGDHFYTTHSSGELASSSGYVYEGIAGYVVSA